MQYRLVLGVSNDIRNWGLEGDVASALNHFAVRVFHVAVTATSRDSLQASAISYLLFIHSATHCYCDRLLAIAFTKCSSSRLSLPPSFFCANAATKVHLSASRHALHPIITHYHPPPSATSIHPVITNTTQDAQRTQHRLLASTLTAEVDDVRRATFVLGFGMWVCWLELHSNCRL